MATKRMLFVVLVGSLVVLAVGVQAQPSGQEVNPAGMAIPYSGRLANETGERVIDEAYDFSFALYESEVGGEPLWSETQEGVTVRDGMFSVSLGSQVPLTQDLLVGDVRWLSVGVRGPGESEATTLTPRQRLSAASPAAVASPNAGAACPHDHFGEKWQGTGVGLTVLSQDWIGLQGLGIQGDLLLPAPIGMIGVYGYGEDAGVYGDGPTGVRGTSSGGDGVWGSSGTGAGVYGTSGSNVGVLGVSTSGAVQEPFGAHGVYGVGDSSGVSGRSNHGTGVWGISQDEVGVAGESTSFHGVYGVTGGNYGWRSGVYGEASQSAANGVTGWNTGAGVGVYGFSEAGTAAHFTDKDTSSEVSTVKIKKKGVGGTALDLQAWDPGGGQQAGHFIAAFDENEHYRFLVAYTGVVAATGYNTWRSDMAEMLPAVEGLEPGDVLVIGPDGKLVRSSKAHQASVAGVYSTEPGFVGGQPMEGEVPGTIPLAVVGVVPVKVVAENGAIVPGDLLVTSSVSGHAMKAGPNPALGTILGKALEGLDASQGSGVIKMLATLQ
jgi:hypothetical protein